MKASSCARNQVHNFPFNRWLKLYQLNFYEGLEMGERHDMLMRDRFERDLSRSCFGRK